MKNREISNVTFVENILDEKETLESILNLYMKTKENTNVITVTKNSLEKILKKNMRKQSITLCKIVGSIKNRELY